MSAAVPRLLLAGATPGRNAGNAVSTEVLHHALAMHAEVTFLAHRMSPLPSWKSSANGRGSQVVLGTQPLLVHGEALVPGLVHRHRLLDWHGAWVVNSRYAGAVHAAGLPYIIWEATTLRDELRNSSFRTVRQSGQGTGLGRTLHSALLPLDDRIERRFYERAVAVLAMSPYTRERIIEQYGLSPDRVGVLLHPPSPVFVDMLARQRPAAGERQRSNPARRLLFVGRADDPRKNFGLLIDSMHHLRAEGVEVSLTVIGPHTDHWRRTLRLDTVGDAVEFSGSVSQEWLAESYLTHDALVVSSHQEGFGIVVAEALAAGLPVISTRCGGPEHILTESGAGILVDHNASAVASAVRMLLEDTDRLCKMRERGRAYAESTLAFVPFADTVANMTSRLLEARPVR